MLNLAVSRGVLVIGSPPIRASLRPAEVAGFEGPLHRCSIYGTTEAGERLNDMMEMGRSLPWPEALALLTGGDGEMDATAILDYFAPLKNWLDEANTRERGTDGARACGVGR